MKAIKWIVIIMFLFPLTGCEMIVELPTESISENDERGRNGGGIGRNNNSSTEVNFEPVTEQIVETTPEPTTEPKIETTNPEANNIGMSFDADTGEWVAINESTESEVLETETITQTLVSEKVYMTRVGTKYHREGCRNLNSRYALITMSKEDAIKNGYTSCDICNP